jgi:hypothetical protein
MNEKAAHEISGDDVRYNFYKGGPTSKRYVPFLPTFKLFPDLFLYKVENLVL